MIFPTRSFTISATFPSKVFRSCRSPNRRWQIFRSSKLNSNLNVPDSNLCQPDFSKSAMSNEQSRISNEQWANQICRSLPVSNEQSRMLCVLLYLAVHQFARAFCHLVRGWPRTRLVKVHKVALHKVAGTTRKVNVVFRWPPTVCQTGTPSYVSWLGIWSIALHGSSLLCARVTKCSDDDQVARKNA